MPAPVDHLAVVAATAERVDEARRDLEVAVRAALEAGASLRAVAREAGVSHEQIRRIAERAS